MFESVSVGGRGKPDTVVVGLFQSERPSRTGLPDAAEKAAAEAASRPEFTGEAGSIAESFAAPDGGRGKALRVVVLGLGRRDSLDQRAMSKAAVALGKRLSQTGDASVGLELSSALARAKADLAHAGRVFAETLGLMSWNYDNLRGTATQSRSRPKLVLSSSQRDFEDGMRYGLGLAVSANYARDLSQTPPNIATPMWMADQAKRLARSTGMKCTVLAGKQLEDQRLRGLFTVGRASVNKPCLVRIEYTPDRAARRAAAPPRSPAVLVGKTLTYDSGGLSLKINNTMAGMKRDKDGGCAVLAAMHAVATVVRPARPVVALLACAENMVSDESYRPDDVLTFRNGVTVEVTNTDAEGRLVLADALCWACDNEKPAFVVDMATLTGGVVVALGPFLAGMWCEDDRLRARVEAAAERSGERVWRLPLNEDYREMMRSPVADILNSNPNRRAHPVQGAAFLSYFVADGVPWAHIDIAGVHAVDSETGPFIKGPTGWGVRLLADLLAYS